MMNSLNIYNFLLINQWSRWECSERDKERKGRRHRQWRIKIDWIKEVTRELQGSYRGDSREDQRRSKGTHRPWFQPPRNSSSVDWFDQILWAFLQINDPRVIPFLSSKLSRSYLRYAISPSPTKRKGSNRGETKEWNGRVLDDKGMDLLMIFL